MKKVESVIQMAVSSFFAFLIVSIASAGSLAIWLFSLNENQEF
jgi:hypothetical protein